jgi:hypothetical protein
MLKETWPVRENGWKLPRFRWEMLLKAVGQPLGTAKGYRKAAGKCPKDIGKLLGNS